MVSKNFNFGCISGPNKHFIQINYQPFKAVLLSPILGLFYGMHLCSDFI